MKRLVFWGSLAVIVYTYLAFPLIVVGRGLLRPRSVGRRPITPSASVIIAARNEEATIGAKVDNLRELDYPPGRLEVVIASDGSTDRTVLIAQERVAASPGLAAEVLDLPPVGKAGALIAAVEASHGEVLVFSDANSMYAPDAVGRLVAPLADPEVGGVAGNQVYSDTAELGEQVGEVGYWGYDRLLKEFESRAGNTIGGTGAIYAIRRSLFRPIPSGVNDDFFLTAGVIDQGSRLVFEAKAVAWEPPADGVEHEFGRKVRVVSRAMRCVATMPGLLNPARTGFYAVQLASHKIMRWLQGVPLAAMFLANLGLLRRHPFYLITFAAQAVFYGLAALGIGRRGNPVATARVVAIPAYFVMVNVAGLRAAVNLLLDRRIDQWQPVRSSGDERKWGR